MSRVRIEFFGIMSFDTEKPLEEIAHNKIEVQKLTEEILLNEFVESSNPSVEIMITNTLEDYEI